MSEILQPQDGADFVAPNESATENDIKNTQEQAVEVSSEAQATLDKLEQVLDIWNENVRGKSMTPYGDRTKEYQMNNIPLLENLRVDLSAGKTTFVDTSERPYKTRPIAEKLEEIYRGLNNV